MKPVSASCTARASFNGRRFRIWCHQFSIQSPTHPLGYSHPPTYPLLHALNPSLHRNYLRSTRTTKSSPTIHPTHPPTHSTSCVSIEPSSQVSIHPTTHSITQLPIPPPRHPSAHPLLQFTHLLYYTPEQLCSLSPSVHLTNDLSTQLLLVPPASNFPPLDRPSHPITQTSIQTSRHPSTTHPSSHPPAIHIYSTASHPS